MILFLLAWVSVLSTGCAGRQTTPKAGVTADPVIGECLRIAASGNGRVPGWRLLSPVNTYNKETIFDYIDGAAELYFAYNFRAVAAAEYQNDKTSIIVDVYDMTTSEGAFGIYSLNRQPEANYVNIGNEGTLTGTALDLWKGRYLCKVYSLDMSGKYQNDVVNFGSILASEIEEAGAEPSVLQDLPQHGLIPKSARFFIRKLGMDNIRYISEKNLLNLGPDTEGAVAEYKIDNSKFQLFLIEYPSPDNASSAFEMYSEHLEKDAELLFRNEATMGKSRMFKVDGRFDFIGVKDKNLWGFWDVETLEKAEFIMQNILLFPR